MSGQRGALQSRVGDGNGFVCVGPKEEMAARRAAWTRPHLLNMTPWEEISRSMVGQHNTGACLEPATLYLNIIETRGESRNNH